MDWKDACKKLQKEGLKFEYLTTVNIWSNPIWSNPICSFQFTPDRYRIAAQPIPDRADWREWCRNLKKLGVEFESQNSNGGWVTYKWGFKSPKTWYRIPAQPIPAGIEKYLEEEMPGQKQDKPESHQWEQQIQWHEDKLHSLRTGEPMREWEYRLVVGDGEWKICNDPHFSKRYEYRRRPRTVTYWHCAVRWGGKDSGIMSSYNKGKFLLDVSRTRSEGGMDVELGPIIKTTVDLED